MICGHSLTVHVYDVENSNMHFMQNPVFNYYLMCMVNIKKHIIIDQNIK